MIFGANHDVPSIFIAADYDLTGQLVWPGAVLLNNYLSRNAEILEGQSVIELGSGVGKLIVHMCCCFDLISNIESVTVVVLRYYGYTVQ